MLVMGGMMLAGLRRRTGRADPVKLANPVWIGVVLSAANPYFLLWWATVELRLATQLLESGALALGLFAVIHWSCDMAWLEALSLASNKGVTLLGPKGQRIVPAVCGAAMGVFGILFVCGAIKSLWS